MPASPRVPIYETGALPDTLIPITTVLAIGLAAITLYVVYEVWKKKTTIGWLYLLIGAWAILPPVWFWWEYFYLYRAYGEPDTLELFKYGQDVAKAIWGGVLAGLIAFAASDAAKPAPPSSAK